MKQIIEMDSSGLKYPDYPGVLKWLTDRYKEIYGNDVYLEPDSKDGQWLAIQAEAMYDTMLVMDKVYHSFSPSTAMGEALSRLVAINGLVRKPATLSYVTLTLTGVGGTHIQKGVAGTKDGSRWNLPDTVLIPISGTIDVLAHCQKPGAIKALPGDIDRILTPVPGWDSVTNKSPAIAGRDMETDAELRYRQKTSNELGNVAILESMRAAILSRKDVDKCRIYENNTNAKVGDIPANSIWVVVKGATTQDVAKIIYRRKSFGVGTYGSKTFQIPDGTGGATTINMDAAVEKNITVNITLKTLSNYDKEVLPVITKKVQDFIRGIDIGEEVFSGELYQPASRVENDNVYAVKNITVEGGTVYSTKQNEYLTANVTYNT